MKGLAGSRARLRSSVARVKRWSGVREHHVVCSTVRRPRSCLSPRPCRTAFTPTPPGVQQLPSRFTPRALSLEPRSSQHRHPLMRANRGGHRARPHPLAFLARREPLRPRAAVVTEVRASDNEQPGLTGGSSLQAAAQQNAEQNRCWATAEQKAICWGRLFGNRRRTGRHSVRRRCWSVSCVGSSSATNWLVNWLSS